MSTKNTKHQSDVKPRIAAVVLLTLGVAVSMWFAWNGFPSFGWGDRSQSTEISSAPFIPRTVNLSHLKLEVADTAPARQRGLSGRDNLDDDAGMLFVFPTSDRHAFWMKDTNFPLDIIWISDGIVVDLVTLPPPYPTLPIPPSHRPKADADLVLELNAGMAKELGIEEGVRLEF